MKKDSGGGQSTSGGNRAEPGPQWTALEEPDDSEPPAGGETPPDPPTGSSPQVGDHHAAGEAGVTRFVAPHPGHRGPTPGATVAAGLFAREPPFVRVTSQSTGTRSFAAAPE